MVKPLILMHVAREHVDNSICHTFSDVRVQFESESQQLLEMMQHRV